MVQIDLPTVRLWFFSVAWIHLVLVAIVVIQIDMSGDSDPKVRAYYNLRWGFLTTWFNLMNLLVYFPLSIYCEWMDKQGDKEMKQIKKLRRVRDVIFTGIMFPVTVYSDIVFWLLYCRDCGLIAPVNLFSYLPLWVQHSGHTVSLVVVVLDLLLVPRQRPKSLKPGLAVFTAFGAVYSLVLYECYVRGLMVYQFMEVMPGFEVMLILLASYLKGLIYFRAQWFVIDYVWGKPTEVKKNR